MTLKNIFIKTPTKTVNQNMKLIVKKKSLKKINEEIKGGNLNIERNSNNLKLIHNNLNNNQINNSKIKTIKNITKPILNSTINKNTNNLVINKTINRNINNINKPIIKSTINRNINNINKPIIKSTINRHFRNNYRNINRNINRKTKIKKNRYIRLLVDSNNDIKGRINKKEKLKKDVLKMSKKELKELLLNKGLIKKNSKAPMKVLTDIYLHSNFLGDINIIT
jgi:hypothetical protein